MDDLMPEICVEVRWCCTPSKCSKCYKMYASFHFTLQLLEMLAGNTW